jgi:hypothetical protein
MEKKFELLPPTMPNFIQFKREAGLKQDGFKVDGGLPISELTESEANEYADLMRATFITHWMNKVAGK